MILIAEPWDVQTTSPKNWTTPSEDFPSFREFVEFWANMKNDGTKRIEN